MADVKWIKLIVTARNSKSMKQIKALPQGKEIALLFYELMQLAGEVNENGFLYYEEVRWFNNERTTIARFASLKNKEEESLYELYENINHDSIPSVRDYFSNYFKEAEGIPCEKP